MTKKMMKDEELNDVFDAAKGTAMHPPADVMSRVLSDAMMVQSEFAAPPVAKKHPGIWPELFRVLGGWPAMAGLATAAMTGVWIGLFPPSFLPDLQTTYLGTDDAAYLIDTDVSSGFDLVEEAI